MASPTSAPPQDNYRHDAQGQAWTALAGTRAQLLGDLGRQITGLDLTCVALLLLTSLPLLVAL